MSPNPPKFVITLTPPSEDQVALQHHRQISSIAMPSGMQYSPLLEARLKEHRKAIEEKKQWDELMKHRRLRPTLPEYDLGHLSPLSAARSRKSRRSRPRRSRRRDPAAIEDGNGHSPRSGGEVRQDSGVCGENVGQRPRDEEVYCPRLASAGQSAAEEAGAAITSSTARKQPPRPRYVRRVWRPTLIRQVIICRIYFKRRATADEAVPAGNTPAAHQPEDLTVSQREPSVPQVIACGSAAAALELKRAVRAIYPEPSKEDGRNNRGDFSRRFGGIDGILFGDMEVRRSRESVFFGSRANENVDNSLTTLKTSALDTTTIQTPAGDGDIAAEEATQEVEEVATNEQDVSENNGANTCTDEECPRVNDLTSNNESSGFITVNETRESDGSDFFVGAVKERTAGGLECHIIDPVGEHSSVPAIARCITTSKSHIASLECDDSGYVIASGKVTPIDEQHLVRPMLTPDHDNIVERCEEVEYTSPPASQPHLLPPTLNRTAPNNPHSDSYTTLLEGEDTHHSNIDDPVVAPEFLPPLGRETVERLSSTSPEKNNPIRRASSRLKEVGLLSLFSKSHNAASPLAGQNTHRNVVGSNGSESSTNRGDLPAAGLKKKNLRSALKHLLKTQACSIASCPWASSGFGNDFMFINHV